MVISVIVGIVVTIAVAVGAVMLIGDTEGADDEAAATDEATQAVPGGGVAKRPQCPSTGVGGIELDCLGAETGPEPNDEGVSVVNIWAWWCAPCREELPHIEAFAEQNPEYTVVGVHADQAAGRGAALLNELDVDLPSYQDDDNTFAGTLGLPGVIPITVVFVDGEQIDYFPTPFASVEEIERAVDNALAEV